MPGTVFNKFGTIGTPLGVRGLIREHGLSLYPTSLKCNLFFFLSLTSTASVTDIFLYDKLAILCLVHRLRTCVTSLVVNINKVYCIAESKTERECERMWKKWKDLWSPFLTLWPYLNLWLTMISTLFVYYSWPAAACRVALLSVFYYHCKVIYPFMCNTLYIRYVVF